LWFQQIHGYDLSNIVQPLSNEHADDIADLPNPAAPSIQSVIQARFAQYGIEVV
jgi:hypothetical protein